jgi:hypothetical protein
LDAAERLQRFDDGIPVPAGRERLEFGFDALQPVDLLIDRADTLLEDDLLRGGGQTTFAR